jgi:hypothetical protein
MRSLSKSKLLAFRQCPKRLWLEIHKPEAREDSESTDATFAVGYQVGEVARRIYDPKGIGQVIDVETEGLTSALEKSRRLLNSSVPLFEVGFSVEGALAFADVMLPIQRRGQRLWRMIEVKSSARVKDYHLDDVAIQAFLVRNSGVPLASISLAHIDTSWIYRGGDDYRGLLDEHDLTKEAIGREREVATWIAEAQVVANKRSEPGRSMGDHCSDPYECGFLAYCRRDEPVIEYPVHWLPRIQAKALKTYIQEEGIADLRHVPDDLLNERQLRVKSHTLRDTTYFDSKGAAADLASYKLPAYFLDFETVQFAVPIWAGTRPYQQIPFQFSVHRLSRTGYLESESFLDLSGTDPSKPFAEALIEVCGRRGPIFVYNAGFESSRIRELAKRFPKMGRQLLAIKDRLVDLLKTAEKHFYHPSQQGSWSIKVVLPTIAPDLRYEALEGVQNGGMAMEAFKEAITSTTPLDRKSQIERELLAYCSLDTLAMVRLWRYFTGTKEVLLTPNT